MALRQARASCGTIIWVDEHTIVGNSVQSPTGHWYLVRELLNVWTDGRKAEVVPPPPAEETEMIPAMELEINDEFIVDNGWVRVTGLNKTQGRWYIYVDCVSPATGRKLPSQKIPKTNKVKIKLRKVVMSVILLNCHELAKSVQAKLIDYQALVDAPERIEVTPSVFVDKEPIMSALKASVKAEYNKLGEQLKKL